MAPSSIPTPLWKNYGGYLPSATTSTPTTFSVFPRAPSITTIAHFLPDLSADEHQHLSDERTAEEIRITSGIVAIPGAVAFFQQLDQLGVPYAVVTSATADLARTRIVAAGLPIPDVLVTPETITQGKPNPEGYLTAASQLGGCP